MPARNNSSLLSFFVVTGLLQLTVSEKVLYRLSKDDYYRMPPLFQMDPYEPCLNRQAGTYCSVKFDIVSDSPNELYNMIQEYSAHTIKHFNHTQLQYGICLTDTCKKFYEEGTKVVPRVVLEACLNDTFGRNYGLKTKVTEFVACEKLTDKINLDTSDLTIALVICIILSLNLIGSFLHFYHIIKGTKRGISFLKCFSIVDNWKRMAAPPGQGPDPRLTRLKGVHGIRTMNIALVIMSHSLMTYMVSTSNPLFIEEAFNQKPYMILTNGTLVVQTFFIMSGFLLLYSLLLHEERHRLTWKKFPRNIFNRWLRLTPAYAVVLALTATWLRHAGSGPVWQSVVGAEAEACRREWWLYLLYAGNYFDRATCMGHTWYLAADFQLHIVGMFVCVFVSRKWRKLTLFLLFVAGIVMPAVHTYLNDLDGNVMVTPEAGRNFFSLDPTFNLVYRRGHTNLVCFVMGLALAIFVYHCQETRFQFNRFIKSSFLYWMTVPGMLAVISAGSVFYEDGPRASILLRTAFAALIKPAFGAVVCYLLLGMIFKFEGLYRGIMEWRGWAAPGRLSYSAYVLHVSIIRFLTGSRAALVYASFWHIAETVISSIVLSFLLAVPLYLMVEAPSQQLVKFFTSGPPNNLKEKEIKKVPEDQHRDSTKNDQ